MSDLFGKDIRKPICDSFESSNTRLDQIFDVAESDVQTYTAILAAGNCRNKTVYALRDGGYTQFDGYLDIYSAIDGGYLGDTTIDTCLLDNKMLFEKDYTLQRYGMKWEKSDPTNRTYLHDCEGWTPMQCQADGSVSRGSWKDSRVFFLKNLYPVMCKSDGTEDYKLSKTDHAYRENGTVPSDVSNTSYDGNAMACFDCHIWIKFFEDDDYQGFEVANYQADENFVDWPYIRADGSHADKLYYPMFEGTVVDGKLRSIGSGKAQSGTTITQELGYAQANDGLGENSVWEIGTWSHHVWFTCLCMLVSKSTCPEDALGAGNSNGGTDATGFVTNGACIDKGAFWGKPHSSTDSDNVYPIKTFFCENMWANREKRTLGFYNASYEQGWSVKTSPPYVINDSYYPNYTGFNDMPTNTGWIEEVQLTSCGFLPKTSGSVTANFGGYLVAPQSYGGKPLALGGTCKSGAACGPWFMDLQYGIFDTQWWIGASLYLIQPSGTQ